MKAKPLISVENLTVSFNNKKDSRTAINNISFEVYENETIGIVGESGSGKSITALSIVRLLKWNNKVQSTGTISYKGLNYSNIAEKKFRSIRGKEIAMIFQEPMSALNPSMCCGDQVKEILLHHEIVEEKIVDDEVVKLFKNVKIPNPRDAINKYPHELSGGQQQRVMIAIAIACKPKILIADEPTTALDVTVQKEIVQLIKQIQKETKMSVIFISHDLALISEIADRTIVMYKGEIVESGTTRETFKNPKHIYTKALIAARPKTSKRLKKLPTINDILKGENKKEYISKKEREIAHQRIYNSKPILEVIDLKKTYLNSVGVFQKSKPHKAIDGVSFKLFEGETLGLVGESGCGKTSLGNAILQLTKPSSGKIIYKGKDLNNLTKKEIRLLRKEIQIIFQDPLASLNPRLSVGEAIIEPMKVHKLYKNYKVRRQKTLDLLNKVGLDESAFNRYPHEFSGGQRQRIGIARTIALKPKLILCDESVSALDVSVQAQVLNLLNSLKYDFGFTYIFISHDLAVVKYMSDNLLIMDKGKIVEMGEADKTYNTPSNAYTKRLINSIPKGL
jgi:peptide/nickel transport system ATP-binding protein